jgi:hypothetical protein
VRVLKIFILSAILHQSFAFAEQRELYSTASFLARGGAMVADVDDINSIFANPAGIPNVPGKPFDITLKLDTSMGFNDFVTAYFGTDPGGRIQTEDEFNAFRGKNSHANSSLAVTYIRDEFAYAFIIGGTIDGEYSNTDNPTVDLFSSIDTLAQISYGRGFLENNKFRVGATAKIAFRMGNFDTVNYDVLHERPIIPLNSSSISGLALAVDIGSQYTWILNKSDISFGFAALDLTTPYLIPIIPNESGNRPPITPARITTGIGWKIKNIVSGLSLNTNFDICKTLMKSESSVMDMIHIGTELRFPQFLKVRAGFNQMYWTFGMGFEYWLLHVDFTTYAENMDIYEDARKSSNRRYVFQFSANF